MQIAEHNGRVSVIASSVHDCRLLVAMFAAAPLIVMSNPVAASHNKVMLAIDTDTLQSIATLMAGCNKSSEFATTSDDLLERRIAGSVSELAHLGKIVAETLQRLFPADEQRT